MSEKIKTNQGDNTNVKQEEIIDFAPLETATREDDKAWNVMEFYGENDTAEREYEPSKQLTPKELEKALKDAKASKVGAKIIRSMFEFA